MNVRGLLVACLSFSVLLAAPLAEAQEELRNDGFVDGQSAGFQSGFVGGEIGASRFIASGPGKLVKVQFLYGGGTEGLKENVNIHVWSDADMMDDPGIELYAGTYGVVASDTAFQEVDLTDKDVTVETTFRVGVEMLHDGLPSIARDDDNTIAADRNFIFASGTTWQRSADLGVTGDWIIRAFVDTGAGGTGGTGGASTGGTGGATGGGGAGGAGGGTGGTGGSGGTDSDDGGCACRAAGTAPSDGLGLLSLLGMVAVYSTRRRRRQTDR